jgi:putative membrane protein
MTRTTRCLLAAGVLLFVGLIAWQGLPAVLSTLSVAGVGLLWVALFHLVPLAIDAGAIRVLFDPGGQHGSLRDTVMTRWAGESANSLMPAGQLGGPVLMVRHLAQRGMAMPQAAAAITVSMTYQLLAQMVFALIGVMLLSTRARAHDFPQGSAAEPLLIGVGALAVLLVSFYLVQRRGLFRSTLGAMIRFLDAARVSALLGHADTFDQAVRATYAHRVRGVLSFALNLIGWLVGTVEVYLILKLIKAPVTWESALLLESLGQAIRAAAFAIPGSLGVQEGGYLMLAPIAGLQPEVALALSLAKRAREFLLGIPGLLYLQFFRHRSGSHEPRPVRDTIL